MTDSNKSQKMEKLLREFQKQGPLDSAAFASISGRAWEEASRLPQRKTTDPKTIFIMGLCGLMTAAALLFVFFLRQGAKAGEREPSSTQSLAVAWENLDEYRYLGKQGLNGVLEHKGKTGNDRHNLRTGQKFAEHEVLSVTDAYLTLKNGKGKKIIFAKIKEQDLK